MAPDRNRPTTTRSCRTSRRMKKQSLDDSVKALIEALREQGREAAARRRTAARRDEDGQGVRRGEAQAAARRQDGRPSRQQGRHLAHRADRGHAAISRTAPRSTSCSTRWACRQPHERRADPGDASGLGLAVRLGRRSARCSTRYRKTGKVRASCAPAEEDLRRKEDAEGDWARTDDPETVDMAQPARRGIPIATPVFDGAR